MKSVFFANQITAFKCIYIKKEISFKLWEPPILLAHPAKGHLSFCYHLVSVICQLLTFESSPLKPLGQMNQNLVGSIYGRSCIKNAHFVPSFNKQDRHWQFLFLVGPFLKIFSSETAWPNDRNLEWSLYGRSSINPLANMDVIDNSLLWLVDFWKYSPLKPLGQIKQNFTGSIYGRSSIRFSRIIPILPQEWSSWSILLSDWLKFKKNSLLKVGGTMNCYFVGIMYGRSCAKLTYFVPIVLLIWPP